jgi:F-type H+-transporting ATPase subunit delta
MAELATIARPYAEALFKASGSDAAALATEIGALARVAANDDVRSFADNPKVAPDQVWQLVTSAAGQPIGAAAGNLLRMVIENGRLSALPEIAAQFHALVNADSGVSDALIESAFPIDDAQLAGVKAALEKRFARRLNPSVVLAPELIGGIRVVVGDEVLDTSVRARLEQMKAALAS